MKIIYTENGEFTPIEIVTIDGEESTNSYEDYNTMVDDLGEDNEYVCED